MSKAEDWQPFQHREDNSQSSLGKSVIDKKYLKAKEVDEEPRRTRKKTDTDTGSRWIAPILLGITIFVSLLLKLFNRN